PAAMAAVVRPFLAGSTVSPWAALALDGAAFLRPVARGVPALDACFLRAGTEVSPVTVCVAADPAYVRLSGRADVLMSGWKAEPTRIRRVSCCSCVVPRTRYNHHFERGPSFTHTTPFRRVSRAAGVAGATQLALNLGMAMAFNPFHRFRTHQKV